MALTKNELLRALLNKELSVDDLSDVASSLKKANDEAEAKAKARAAELDRKKKEMEAKRAEEEAKKLQAQRTKDLDLLRQHLNKFIEVYYPDTWTKLGERCLVGSAEEMAELLDAVMELIVKMDKVEETIAKMPPEVKSIFDMVEKSGDTVRGFWDWL